MKEKKFSIQNLALEENQKFHIFQYQYLLDMKDKIFHALGDDELRKEILQKVNSCFQKDYNDSLAGEIALEHLLTNDELSVKIRKFLSSRVGYSMKGQVRDVEIKPKNAIHNDIWLNRMEANEYNPAHVHGGFLSWIWYIDIPEEIRKESNNNKSMGLVEFKSCRSNELMRFNPSSNDFLMFNADHMHTVYPFRSNVTRISLAGNIHEVIY